MRYKGDCYLLSALGFINLIRLPLHTPTYYKEKQWILGSKKHPNTMEWIFPLFSLPPQSFTQAYKSHVDSRE